MQSSKDFLSRIFLKIKVNGIIDEEIVKYFDSIFLNKSLDILEVLKRGITKYTFKPSNRILWTAIGENDEYIIYPRVFCGCYDFYNSVILKRKNLFCKHLIAQTASEALNKFKEVAMKDEEFLNLIYNIKLEQFNFSEI